MMCLRRRVYFQCLHEDNDVTPPRQLLYCGKAQSQDDTGDPAPCAAADTLPYTKTYDFSNAVMRAQECEACKARNISWAQAYQAQGAANRGQSSSSHNRTIFNTHASSAQDPDDTWEGDAFEFDWDLDDALRTTSQEPPNTTDDGVNDNQLFGLGAGTGLSNTGSTPSVTMEDFQLFDDEDEFEDEMEDISSTKAVIGSYRGDDLG
ncbi:hypothetical protein F5Y04DRAFT_81231 [Hypomontagnella monticulosa]|nr:hypothetical protein F5Y04DRAFT_81231 [Hypomontagnella monticulosa]